MIKDISFSGIIEATFALIFIYLVVSQSFGFSRVITAFGETYVNAVKTLQGR